MNYREKIEIIKKKMNDNGFSVQADEILQKQLVLGTPGEVFSAVSFYLNKLRMDKAPAYKAAKNEIDEIVDYAKSINYIQ